MKHFYASSQIPPANSDHTIAALCRYHSYHGESISDCIRNIDHHSLTREMRHRCRPYFGLLHSSDYPLLCKWPVDQHCECIGANNLFQVARNYSPREEIMRIRPQSAAAFMSMCSHGMVACAAIVRSDASDATADFSLISTFTRFPS